MGLQHAIEEAVRHAMEKIRQLGKKSDFFILQTARIYSGIPGKVSGWRSAVGLRYKFNWCAV